MVQCKKEDPQLNTPNHQHTTMQAWIIVPLILTLLFCTKSDIKTRTVPHIYWIPYLILAAVPLYLTWTQPLSPPMILTIIGAVLLYFLGKIYQRGADAVALIIITLSIPIIGPYPSLLLIGPLSICTAALLAKIPCIAHDWDKNKVPFLLPITITTICMIPVSL